MLLTKLSTIFCVAGSTVARYCGKTLHQRLIDLDSFQEGSYTEALRRTFLKTDEELLDGKFGMSPPLVLQPSL